MSLDGESAPSLPLERDIRSLLDACQACGEDPSSKKSFGEALKSLHRELVVLTTQSESTNCAQSSSAQDVDVGGESPTSQTKEVDFLRNVARELINIDRVIFSVDDEINSEDFQDQFDYDRDCNWYNDAMRTMTSWEADCDTTGATALAGCDNFSQGGTDHSCDDPERWIDRCLDVCGYAISLEAAVDCLRQEVHAASHSSFPTSVTAAGLKEDTEKPVFAAVITSLRTVRRRLLLTGSLSWKEAIDLTCVPGPHRDLLIRLKGALEPEKLHQLLESMILPLEYHNGKDVLHSGPGKDRQEPQRLAGMVPNQNQALSDSLAGVSTTVLPALISSACYAINLPLPSWSSPKRSFGTLFHSALKILLVAKVLDGYVASIDDASPPSEGRHLGILDVPSPTMSAVATNHFQLLVKHMIENGQSEIVAKHAYDCWKSSEAEQASADDFDSPRSIVCAQLNATIASLASKREVSMFSRSILRHCVKQEMPKSANGSHLSQRTRDVIDDVCKTNIVPFLCGVLLPVLSKDLELAQALVQFIILCPPTSYHIESEPSSLSYPVLQASDKAVPRCLSQMLKMASAEAKGCGAGTKSLESGAGLEESDSDESDDSSSNSDDDYLSHLFAVASVWCENVFITRTDSLQQQYVTEFLLYPLECKQLNQSDLQRGIADDGTSLATMLVQGVTLRLEMSRPESIRADGMRLAEAMASLLGQTLRFDELGRPDELVDEKHTDRELLEKRNKQRMRRKTKRRASKQRVTVMVDPDAVCESDSSDSSSQSESSASSCESSDNSDSDSSWGEDSLQPYSLEDDEEDLRRVPRPRGLRDCLSYLLTPENDDLAYDKHCAALTELAPVLSSQPLDLLDVIPTLFRVLLFLEDTFNMQQFASKRWESLMAVATSAPLESCVLLVGEMRGNISLGTRLEALALLQGVAMELSGANNRVARQERISDNSDISDCSTRLRLALNLNSASNDGGEGAAKDLSTTNTSKTRRWRQPRAPTTTSPNRFGGVSVQMMYSLLAYLAETKADESIWGGPTGEKFLAEFLKTLSIMLFCARTYPSSSLKILARDLFELAWSLRDATNSTTRQAALLAMAISVSMLPIEFVVQNAGGLSSFLNQCAIDDSSDCRQLGALINGSIAEVMNPDLIERA